MESITLSDVADALGLSVTTVSRALSGKGRVAESTQELVRSYISEHSYRPNRNAQALSLKRSFCIGVLVPMDALVNEVWFFHRTLMSSVRTASSFGYDTIVSVHDEGDSLSGLISTRKADGYILLRAIENDVNVHLLSSADIPFAVIGTSENEKAIAVACGDEDNASRLTDKLVSMGASSFLLILGDMRHTVNLERQRGVLRSASDVDVISGVIEKEDIERALQNAECYDAVIAGDDLICSGILESVPAGRIKLLASLYPSPLLRHTDVIMAEGNDPTSLGETAATLLIDRINNRKEDSGNDMKNTEMEE